MAGESPDRSKQHESSAEPTSGSRVPVPDPRLAVARETVTAAARADTATAVFSTKRSADSTGSAGSADAEESAEPAAGSSLGSDGSAEPEKSAEGAGKGTGGGDARLRSAVAAQAATADEEAPEGAPADSAAPGAGSAAPGADEGASGGDGGDADARADGDGADGDGVEPEASGAGSDVTGGAPDDGSGRDADSDSDADADSDAGSGSGEAGSGAGTGAAAGPDSKPEAGASDEVAGEAKSGSEGVAPADAPAERAVPRADSAADADAPPSSGTAASGESAGNAAADGSAVGTAGTKADTKAGSTAGSKPDAKRTADDPEAEAPAAKPPVGATPAADADSASEPASSPDADSGPESAAKSDSVAKPDVADVAAKSGSVGTSGRTAKPDSATDAGPAAPAAKSGSASDEGEPEPPVDQATAIFKRPPAVDQPTTMLKLGGAKPDAGAGKTAGPGKTAEPGKTTEPGKTVESDKGAASKAVADDKSAAGSGAEAAAASKAEAPPERTSKFVALKPLDEPAPTKARPAVPPPGPSVSPSAAPAGAAPQVGPERTTQQPLPPRPPLDLLAELTNTPPPRQTPVRTLVRRVKIWTPLVLLLAVVFAVVQAVRPLPSPTLALTADETYAFKGNKVSLPWPEEGQGWMDVNGIGTVDSFGEQKPVAIGSVAKAMTAYVILKEHPLKAGADGAKIPVDKKAETEGGFDAQGESTLNTVKEGDSLTEKDAIAAIMIPSANNIARLLARWDAGSEAKFVEKMNAAAKELGMKNTKYTDPSGLKETTVSTAEDQVKLGNELVDIKALVDITKLPTWVDPSGKKWDNYNRLVPYNNAIGIKTGSTTKAGGNLLFAATQEVGGENVIVVGAILGQHTPPIIDTVNAVSKEAMIAAQDALTSQKILKKGDVVGYVDDGLGGQVPVVATKDVSAVGWAGQTVKLKLDEGGTAIPHEAKAGTKVGSLSVGDGTGDAVEVPVALQSDLSEPGFGAKLTRVA
ncbi:D-alanyl-D-alanine carboxypeptidase [Streptomyces sp. NPDC127119]|uniref:D-alanyl-D-alanine carboxypeptidase n=1 Tax=Streptomyces sp. NPDC127119 TaxID=3345370 RepID=UPI0036367513